MAPGDSPKREGPVEKSQGSPLWLRRGPRKFVKRGGGVLPFFARTKFRGGPSPLGLNGPGSTGPIVLHQQNHIQLLLNFYRGPRHLPHPTAPPRTHVPSPTGNSLKRPIRNKHVPPSPPPPTIPRSNNTHPRNPIPKPNSPGEMFPPEKMTKHGNCFRWNPSLGHYRGRKKKKRTRKILPWMANCDQ